MQWDLFAKVVDNHGDIGFAWRLAADLAARGESVRLWIDDAAALAWMAPEGAEGVRVGPWHEAAGAVQGSAPAEVVVETFGCGLPDAYALALTRRQPTPVWIDVEYLSAESYVERSHGLPSPRTMPDGSIRTQWFFYPGFTLATGGLVHEPGLAAAQRAFDRRAWIAAHVEPAGGLRPGERVVSLFCYDNPRLPALLEALAAEPTLLLSTAGLAARQVERQLGPTLARGALRAVTLPLLSQPDYDRLLWACDLNLVRGEDSFVRAQWAGAPFLWQIYPQADDAHARKLEAFLDLFLHAAAPALQADVRAAFRAWNGLGPWGAWPDRDSWSALCRGWRDRLAAELDLTRSLQTFARARTL